ncbi:MAG: hypothetical protein ACK4GO_01555 [Gemmobacter sp.]
MFMQDITRLNPVAALVTGAPVTTGLTAATLVETRAGWRAVGSLRRGEAVQTLDGGLRRIAAVERMWILPQMGADVIDLPGGTFGNDDAVTLLPGQHLLTDLTRADLELGDLPDALAVLVPAAAIEGWCGARRRRVAAALEVVTPLFEEEEYVWAASGLLLHCPAMGEGAGSVPSVCGVFPRLGEATARRLLAARADGGLSLPGWAA